MSPRKFRAAVPALLVATLLLASHSEAMAIAGVAVPRAVKIGGQELSLNGASLQERFVFDVTVVSFYASDRITNVRDAISTDRKKHLRFVLLRDLSQNQLHEAVQQGLSMATDGKLEPIREHSKRFFAALPAVRRGDVMSITFVPGEGTTLRINGKRKITIDDPKFSEAIFAVWLGAKPIDTRVQKNLLIGR